MSIVDNILNRFGFVSQAELQTRLDAMKRDLEQVARWQSETADVQRHYIPDPAIFANQADLYRLSPDLGTALDVLCNDIGTAKFNVKRMRGEQLKDIPNHEFELLLRNPNPMDSGLELMRDTVCNYKLNGNAVWWLNREDELAKVDEIWAIPYQMITPKPDGRLYLSHYEYLPGNGKAPLRFETWEIMHFKTYNPGSRYWGLSPLESLVVTITGNLGKRKTSKDTYIEHNGAPPGILAFGDWVPDEHWQDIKKEKTQAAKRNEMMMLRGVGDKGVSWMQRTMSNKEADFIEMLKQDTVDIFNRMCPGLLAMLAVNTTEANALAASAFYDDKTLWPMMEVIAQKVTSDILPSYGIKLVGVFDDPRYVDRKLKLSEQEAFERSHTLDETREEYYQDEPIGDERGKELVIHAGPLAKEEPPMPPPNGGIPVPDWPQAGREIGDEPTPNLEQATENTGAEDVTAKAAIEELKKWRRMAIQGTEKDSKAEKAMNYASDLIPASTMKTIKAKLGVFRDKESIARIFDGHIEALKFKPKPDENILKIADALNNFSLAAKKQEERLEGSQLLNDAIKALLINGGRSPVYNVPAPIVNLPPAEQNFYLPKQDPPNANINWYTSVEPARPSDVHVDSPVNIYPTVEPAAPVTYLNNQFTFPEQPAPINQFTFPEQPAPINQFTIENNLPAQETTLKAELIMPEQAPSTLHINVPPSTIENTINVQPTPIENNVEVKTPKEKKRRQKIERDPSGNIESTTTDVEYED